MLTGRTHQQHLLRLLQPRPQVGHRRRVGQHELRLRKAGRSSAEALRKADQGLTAQDKGVGRAPSEAGSRSTGVVPAAATHDRATCDARARPHLHAQRLHVRQARLASRQRHDGLVHGRHGLLVRLAPRGHACGAHVGSTWARLLGSPLPCAWPCGALPTHPCSRATDSASLARPRLPKLHPPTRHLPGPTPCHAQAPHLVTPRPHTLSRPGPTPCHAQAPHLVTPRPRPALTLRFE
jgi:hypothetical protein